MDANEIQHMIAVLNNAAEEAYTKWCNALTALAENPGCKELKEASAAASATYAAAGIAYENARVKFG